MNTPIEDSPLYFEVEDEFRQVHYQSLTEQQAQDFIRQRRASGDKTAYQIFAKMQKPITGAHGETSITFSYIHRNTP